MSNKKAEPRIILFDLEILANLKEAYKIWPSIGNWPGLTLRADINSIICCGWKVLGEPEVHCITAWDFKTKWRKNINDDSSVCKAILKALDGADGFIFHNGMGFDLPFLLTRLELNGLETIPADIKRIDTKRLAKKLFFVSKSLNHLGRVMVGEEKLEHDGWKLWPKVMERDAKSMKLMEDYCKQDVLLLEKIFLKLRKFGKMPNFGTFEDGLHKSCPNCGSVEIVKKGLALSPSGAVRQRYRCKSCGSNSYKNIKKDKPQLKA